MRGVVTVILTSMFVAGIGSSGFAANPYGSCSDTAQAYQERYETHGQVQDMVCMQKALEREMTGGPSYSCSRSAQSYQTAYESTGRTSGLVCMQEALKRELQ